MGTTTDMLGIAALAAFVSATAGCSTEYVPRRSPRVAIIQEGGAPAFYKDGRTHKMGFLGSGIVDVVEGVPAAEEHASTYRSRVITGFALSMTGSVAVGVGAGLAVPASVDKAQGTAIAAVTVMGSGLALLIAGLVFTTTAQPHLWDAINVYNDAVSPPYVPVYGPPPMPMPPPYGPAPLPAALPSAATPPPPFAAPPASQPAPPAPAPPPAYTAPPASRPAPPAPVPR